MTPTISELARFTRRTCGVHSPEFGFVCRFHLLALGLGPELSEEEEMLLLLLIEAWRGEHDPHYGRE